MTKEADKAVKCPVCDSGKTEIVYKELGDKSYFVQGKFNLLKCSDCGLIFIDPLLNEKELAKYYPEKKYYSFKNINKISLYYHKISALYHKNLAVRFFLFPFKSLLYTYYVGGENVGKSVLEIGCGDGLKLDIYQKNGLKTAGIEPYGSEISEKEKKLGILRQSVKQARFPDNGFDYIILKEVLEHVPDQKLILKKCYKWLKKGGKLIITIPNTDSLWEKKYKENWFGYDVPRHLYNYNKKNISIFLKKFGFKINKIRVYDSPYMLAGSLKFELIARTGKKKHAIVYSPLTKILFAPISLIVSYLGKGSLMEIECEK